MSEMPSMDDALERLRRLKSLPPASRSAGDFEDGILWGRRWGMAAATPLELERLETFHQGMSEQWSTLNAQSGKDVMKRVAAVVTGMEFPDRRETRKGHIPLELREFWPARVGLAERPEDCLGFVRGFCEGAVQFWREAKDKL